MINYLIYAFYLAMLGFGVYLLSRGWRDTPVMGRNQAVKRMLEQSRKE